MHYICYFLSVILLFLSCSHQNENIEFLQREEFIIPKEDVLKITNTSKLSTKMRIDINHYMAYSIKDLVKRIRLEGEDDNDIINAWRFVNKNLSFFNPPNARPSFDLPLMIYNSTGYGYCSNYCVLLKEIYREMGYMSRIVKVRNHIVVEVFNNNRWEMYDPLQYVYYLNRNNQVASVEELSKDSTLITQPQKIIYDENITMEERLRYHQNYGHAAVQYFWAYQSQEYSTRPIAHHAFIEIPPKASLQLPIQSEIIKKTGAFGTVFHTTYAKYTIPKGEKGIFINPFLIASIEGNGIIKINNQKFSLNGFSVMMNYDNLKEPPLDFEIVKSNSDICVYVLLDDKFILDENIIDVYQLDLNNNKLKYEIRKDYLIEKGKKEIKQIINSEEFKNSDKYYLKIASSLNLNKGSEYNKNLFLNDISTFFRKNKDVDMINDKIRELKEDNTLSDADYSVFHEKYMFLLGIYIISNYPTQDIVSAFKILLEIVG